MSNPAFESFIFIIAIISLFGFIIPAIKRKIDIYRFNNNLDQTLSRLDKVIEYRNKPNTVSCQYFKEKISSIIVHLLHVEKISQPVKLINSDILIPMFDVISIEHLERFQKIIKHLKNEEGGNSPQARLHSESQQHALEAVYCIISLAIIRQKIEQKTQSGCGYKFLECERRVAVAYITGIEALSAQAPVSRGAPAHRVYVRRNF
ncbi:hypothetical protein [Breoghania sp.]|uniref:hypothetical protein n=1 Tax=Breoghania sp. TaxID=2065378 RepID=UPI002AA84FA7|nr:hypothetical protein [Breoghania sp.]